MSGRFREVGDKSRTRQTQLWQVATIGRAGPGCVPRGGRSRDIDASSRREGTDVLGRSLSACRSRVVSTRHTRPWSSQGG